MDGIFAEKHNVIFDDILITYFTSMAMVGTTLFIFNYVGPLLGFTDIALENRYLIFIERKVDYISVGRLVDLFIQSYYFDVGFVRNDF